MNNRRQVIEEVKTKNYQPYQSNKKKIEYKSSSN